MKNFITLTFLFLFFSCSSIKKTSDSIPYSDFKIVKTPIVTENDTLFVNELRFYKIQSALDGMKIMYRNYGKWSEKSEGKYQGNIHQIVWRNLNLLESDDSFTVIADGTETMTDYFASLIVMDKI